VVKLSNDSGGALLIENDDPTYPNDVVVSHDLEMMEDLSRGGGGVSRFS